MGKWRDSVRFACVVALAAVLTMVLASCAQQAQTPASGGALENPAQAQGENALYGSPWVSSVFAGNLPDAAPEAVEDLYLHYAYDYAAEHRDASYASAADDAKDELEAAVTAVIKDHSVESPELEQLRILYAQAADVDAREAAGAEGLKPYLRAVLDTKSLDELEAVLLSDGFPFSPWIETTVSAPDMKSNMCVAVMPCMLFTDAESDTGVYQDADDEETQAAHELMLVDKRAFVEADLVLLSLAEDADQASKIADSMFELEKSYGKDENPKAYRDAGYGAVASAVQFLTFDELTAACPNFPMRETLAKLGEDAGDGAVVMYPAWLSSFDEVWTEENFELLRTMTAVKVLRECSDFIAPSFYDGTRVAFGQDTPTPDRLAYVACDKKETFSQLLAETYTERVLGKGAEEELEQLANDLIDSYIELVGDTSWLEGKSREAIIDKIDNMALNILYPDGGYFDYSGLKLTPAAEGGTLLGNYLAIKAYNDKLEAELIGQPARASATWLYLRPTTQNCFYDAVSNSINVLPGYVTSAVYAEGMAPEELLASMGFVMGHEISHAFDYSGSQFDAYGRPVAVFAEADVREFTAKRQGIAERYSTFEVAPGAFVDGDAVSDEATADLSGLQVVLKRARGIEGFDYGSFFGSFARSWTAVYSPAYAEVLLAGAHAPGNLRVNASSQMLDGFYDTYGAADGNAMYLAPESRIAMWGETSG